MGYKIVWHALVDHAPRAARRAPRAAHIRLSGSGLIPSSVGSLRIGGPRGVLAKVSFAELNI